MKVIFDENKIKLIDLFQRMTGSNTVDCIDNDDTIYFLVKEGQYGLAVGKGGIKIKNVESRLKKTVKIFEYSEDIEKFIRNLIPDTKEISITDESIIVKVKSNARAKVIGKSGKNMKIANEFLKRHFNRDDLKVK